MQTIKFVIESALKAARRRRRQLRSKVSPNGATTQTTLASPESPKTEPNRIEPNPTQRNATEANRTAPRRAIKSDEIHLENAREARSPDCPSLRPPLSTAWLSSCIFRNWFVCPAAALCRGEAPSNLSQYRVLCIHILSWPCPYTDIYPRIPGSTRSSYMARALRQALSSDSCNYT